MTRAPTALEPVTVCMLRLSRPFPGPPLWRWPVVPHTHTSRFFLVSDHYFVRACCCSLGCSIRVVSGIMKGLERKKRAGYALPHFL